MLASVNVGNAGKEREQVKMRKTKAAKEACGLSCLVLSNPEGAVPYDRRSGCTQLVRSVVR